jgi:hypothetical protein
MGLRSGRVACLQHVGRPLVIQAKDSALASPRRGPEALGARNTLAVDLFASLRVIASYQAAVLPE